MPARRRARLREQKVERGFSRGRISWERGPEGHALGGGLGVREQGARIAVVRKEVRLKAENVNLTRQRKIERIEMKRKSN